MYTRHAPVPWTPTFFQYLWVDAFSVIAHNHTENIIGVAYLRFNRVRVRMPESILDQFCGNSKNLFSDDRRKAPVLAFYDNVKTR